MRRSRWLGSVFALAMFVALPAAAQPPDDSGAIQFRVGGFFPAADGQFWQDNEDVFTLDDSDFREAVIGVTFLTPINNRLEVGFNADFYDSTVLSAYRDFVDQDGFPIFHDTKLTMVPLVVDLRVFPGGRYGVRGSHGQRFVQRPAVYVGAGLGTTYWEYEEVGDFLDFTFDPPEIFFDRFTDDGFAFAAHALAGIELPFGKTWSLNFEGRYTWADDTLADDFAGLGDLELDGASAHVGFTFNF